MGIAAGVAAKREGGGHGIAAGLLSGAIVGMIAALASVPLRRLAGVEDRSLINGVWITTGALLLWGAVGVLYSLLPRLSETARWLIGGMTVLTGFVAAVIALDAGPLAPYPARFATLALPLLLIVTMVGTVIFLALLRTRLPLVAPSAAGFVAAVAVAVAIVHADPAPTVRYTLSHVSAATPAAGSGVTAASAPASTAAAAGSTPAGAAGSMPAVPGSTSGSTLHFSVSSSDSQASYTVREKLAQLPAPSDAVGKTSAISGDLYLTQAGLAGSPASSFKVDLRTLTSDANRRDQFLLNNSLQSNTYPYATFTITGIDGFPANYQEGQQVKVSLSGDFTVHDTTRPLTWTGVAQYASGRLEAVLSTDFNMTDFNITPPNLPIVQAQNEVHLDLHLVLQQQPS